MATLNPDQLLAQAERLIRAPPAGPPLQVDVRRAISAAYYSVFHAVLTAAANAVVGGTKRTSAHYVLVYRSVDHRRLRELCDVARRPLVPPKYIGHVPSGGFGEDVRTFAALASELQEKRHTADYDPGIIVRTADASLAISNARAALRHWNAAPTDARNSFLMLLLFPPR
jgi:hypothetical protein